MRVVIVEDNLDDAEQLKKYLKKYGQDNGAELEIVHYGDADSFLRSYQRERAAIVFFDIVLPGIDGMSAARELRRMDTSVVILFFTKSVQLAYKGYEINALDFLVKPVAYSDFQNKMHRAVSVAKASEVNAILVPAGNDFYRVDSDKIVFVEVSGHYLKYQLVDGFLKARGTLSKVQETLERQGFLRCNSCYLVNVRYIESVHGYDLKINGYSLKISRPRRKGFVKQLIDACAGNCDILTKD